MLCRDVNMPEVVTMLMPHRKVFMFGGYDCTVYLTFRRLFRAGVLKGCASAH